MTSDASGTYRGVYTYGLDRIAERDLASVEGVPNDPLYYLYDGRGSVTQLVNSSNHVRDKYRYTPFGVPMPGGQLTPNTRLFNNPYGYNGEDYDIESGLQFLRARYYNPETARFISRDSYLGDVMEPLSLNRYAYTRNNPVMNIDPSGHDIMPLPNPWREKSVRSVVISHQKPTLKLWSKETDSVIKLQKFLKSQGYSLGTSGVDGIFGGKTEEAVKDFQGDNGLKVDGIVGTKTWSKIDDYINGKVSQSKANSNNKNGCGDGGEQISSGTKDLGSLPLKLDKYSHIKDPAGGVYLAWNATLPHERIPILKIEHRFFAGTEMLQRLSYLQYRKDIDVTKLTLNELDKIYEKEHSEKVDMMMVELSITGGMAANSKNIADDILNSSKNTKGVDKSNFSSIDKLEGHFAKHGGEFKGVYKNADEYLQGAREVMNNGYKVQYKYKDEIRTGYVKFMETSKKGISKFEFVGTNNLGEITTYHVESGKDFWKMLNGQNIPVINLID